MLQVSVYVSIIGVGNEKGRFSVWKYLMVSLCSCAYSCPQ